MRPLGTCWSNLSNGYHGNNDRYKNFDVSLGYVFPNSMTVENFITIKWQENKLSMIKIFNYFVSDHLKNEIKCFNFGSIKRALRLRFPILGIKYVCKVDDRVGATKLKPKVVEK